LPALSRTIYVNGLDGEKSLGGCTLDYVDQSHWDRGYEALSFSVASDRVTQWLAKHVGVVDRRAGRSAFEFGCFPGRYLSFVGSLGYSVSGCDLTPRTDEMSAWLSKSGLEVGSISRADALQVDARPLHDFVYSIGFLEHFSDYASVIRAHDRLLKPGGLLILSCPNFRGEVQRYLHSRLDLRNFSSHNLDAMNPAEWSEILSCLGYRVDFSGFFGGFDFWTDRGEEQPSISERVVSNAVKALGRVSSRAPDSPRWSPYIGLVARKA
jgi:2-polyprenyl-3-methyl-5-hydroxy-6-metoxy-1,4-benzoquinol methylase